MIEKPILYSGEMVQAVLDGRKTHTRRVVKGKWLKIVEAIISANGKLVFDTVDYEITTPYGVPGDRLWVRENFRVGAWRDDPVKVAFDYLASPELRNTQWCLPEPGTDRALAAKYILQSIEDAECAMADGDSRVWEGEKAYEWAAGNGPCRNRPSIFMPRWASRILLDVVDVRVERLQDISIEDAMREGVPYTELNNSRPDELHRGQFADLWEKINGKPRKDGVDISWAANPWVWVVDFRKVED